MSMTMNQKLHERLINLKWSEDKISKMVWGTRLEGDPHGVLIEHADGRTRYYPGPFTSVKEDGQIAIVRFG